MTPTTHAVGSATLLLCMLSVTGIARAQCPRLDPTAGYPVTAAWADTTGPDVEYLEEFARAVAYRWQVPSYEREYARWRRIRRLVQPPEPRWADGWERVGEWRPDHHHRAELLVSVRRNGRATLERVVASSGDATFDRSLPSIVRQPMPGAPDFPSLPDDFPGQSVRLRLLFGPAAVDAPHARIHFAAYQRPALQLTPFRFEVPVRDAEQRAGERAGDVVTIKFDVSEEGMIEPASIEVIGVSAHDLVRAIREGVLASQLSPAESNCRKVAVSVVLVTRLMPTRPGR